MYAKLGALNQFVNFTGVVSTENMSSLQFGGVNNSAPVNALCAVEMPADIGGTKCSLRPHKLAGDRMPILIPPGN